MSDNTYVKAADEFSDRDLDALLEGRRVADPRLEGVNGALQSLRATLITAPDDEQAALMAGRMAEATPSQSASAPATSASAANVRRSWKGRFAVTGALIATSVVGVAGAAAANEAAPGDPLFAVDQALESVGILDGGTDERLDEAAAMADDGDESDALEYAADALEEDGDDDAALELRNAARAVLQNSTEGDTREAVAAMLQWMVTAERGPGFGQEVSSQARALHQKDAAADQSTGGAEDTAADAVVADEPAQVETPAPGNSANSNGSSANSNGNSANSNGNAASSSSTDVTSSESGDVADSGMPGNSNATPPGLVDKGGVPPGQAKKSSDG